MLTVRMVKSEDSCYTHGHFKVHVAHFHMLKVCSCFEHVELKTKRRSKDVTSKEVIRYDSYRASQRGVKSNTQNILRRKKQKLTE